LAEIGDLFVWTLWCFGELKGIGRRREDGEERGGKLSVTWVPECGLSDAGITG
jgi:hypothetical protein